MSDVLLQDRDVALAYPARRVLEGLTAEYRRGERFVLIGANGSGKSTFLKAVVDPSLIAEGRRTVTVPAERISHLPQQSAYGARSSMGVPCSVRDFLVSSYVLTLGQRAAAAEDVARVDAVLDRLGLAARARDPISTLSGGQMQRLCFGRALLLRSEILLLDEPFSAIDSDSKELLRSLLDELRAATLQILVLHDPLDVLSIGAPILRAVDGRLERVSEDEYRRWQQRRFDVVTFH